MSQYTDIKQAISMHLAASVNTWSISMPNFKFDPSEHGNFLKISFLPGDTEQATLGPDGVNRNYGVVQIGIFTPLDESWLPASEKVDEIATIFKRGMILINDGVEVHITNVSERPGKPDEEIDKYFIPVNITYYADTTN